MSSQDLRLGYRLGPSPLSNIGFGPFDFSKRNFRCAATTPFLTLTLFLRAPILLVKIDAQGCMAAHFCGGAFLAQRGTPPGSTTHPRDDIIPQASVFTQIFTSIVFYDGWLHTLPVHSCVLSNDSHGDTAHLD